MKIHFELKFNKSIKIGLGAIACLAVLGVAYAAISQTIPSVVIPAQSVTLVGNCTGALNEELTPTPVSGLLSFDCAPGTSAFNVPSAGSSTPTFTRPTGYTALGVVERTTATVSATCGTGGTFNSNVITISNNAAVFLNPTTSHAYDYCATYSVAASGATLASFSVSWAP